MSANEYPADLKVATWEKKKGSLPPGSDVIDKLKLLQKKHEAANWKLFDGGWSTDAKSPADLEAAYEKCRRAYLVGALPLEKEAGQAANAAQALLKDKAAGKPAQDAGKAIAAAAAEYGKAIKAGLEEIEETYEKLRATLQKKGGTESEAGEDEDPGHAMLEPKRLLQQLQLLKRDPQRKVQFAFVDGKDKVDPVLAMHPKVAAKKIFALGQEQNDVKTGAFGTAWIAENALILQLDKPLSGLVKKVRGPLKAVGFKVGSVVLWSADGKVFEQDDEAPEGDSEASATPKPDIPEAPPAPPLDRSAEFATRLKALMARLAANPAAAADGKLLLSEAGVHARKKDWAAAMATLDRAEALLGPAPSPPPGTRGKVAPAIVYTQSRLAWVAARTKVRADLEKLEAAILDIYDGDAVLPRVRAAVRQLDAVLTTFDESLADKLDEALNSADPDEKARLHGEARTIIDRYRQRLDTDPLVRRLDDNPFAPVAVHATLSRTLETLGAKIV